MSLSDELTPQDIGLSLTSRIVDKDQFSEYLDLPLSEAKTKLVEDFERLMLARAIKLENGNISAAARRLGIHRQSLQQKVKSLSIALDE